MIELSLFSGVGGGLLATQHLLKWRTVGYVEIDSYCQKVLTQRIKDGFLDAAPIFGDIKHFNNQGYAKTYKGVVDIITGGFPCQDISSSKSKGKGIKGEKSGLWYEMAKTICIVRPKYVLVENSPMLTHRGLDEVLKSLAQMGYNAKWGVFSAVSIGALHERERIFILAYSRCNNTFEDEIYKTSIAKKLRSRTSGKCRCSITADGRKRRVLPTILRAFNGVADPLERCKAIGNGQVPTVVALAWHTLSKGCL